MPDPDLFRALWVKDQLELMGLRPGDPNYDNARQAAEAGWPAHSINKLLSEEGDSDGCRH
jgi:hypothetical protein